MTNYPVPINFVQKSKGTTSSSSEISDVESKFSSGRFYISAQSSYSLILLNESHIILNELGVISYPSTDTVLFLEKSSP